MINSLPAHPSANPNGHRDLFFDLDYVYDPFGEPDFSSWINFLYHEEEELGSTHPLTGEPYV